MAMCLGDLAPELEYSGGRRSSRKKLASQKSDPEDEVV